MKLAGFLLLLIDLVFSIYFLIGWYRGIKSEAKTSNRVLVFIMGFLDILNPFSFSGLVFMASLIAILAGFALVTGLIH